MSHGGDFQQHAASNGAVSQEIARRRRSFALRATLAACAVLLFACLVGLGTWQVKRLQWKLDLIERVDQRVHTLAIAAPERNRWPQINAASDEYRHVYIAGTFLYDQTVRVQASTALGSGFWLLTPLRSANGDIVLINRGFIPAQAAARHDFVTAQSNRATQRVSTVTGLLRMSEPGGGFLRHNDPAANRWYSRDVQAVAAAEKLTSVAPYFVDADAAKDLIAEDNSPEHPVGGLTVTAFPNNHLVYAITWYALALMVAGAFWWVVREERELPGQGADTNSD